MSTGNILKKCVFVRKTSFPPISEFERKCCVRSTCREKILDGKTRFCKKNFNDIPSDFNRSISGSSAENFWQGCQNCNLLVPRNILKKNSCSEKIVFFSSISDSDRKFLVLQSRKSQPDCQSGILPIRQNFLRNLKLGKSVFINFGY